MNNNKKTLSIVTINLNNSFGLEKTIKSVISQTFNDYEFIIIDGGSKDGSQKVIDKYKNDISYFVSEKDTGIYNAINKGIKKATGKYMQFLNSGDFFLDKNILKKVFNTNFNEDIAYGSSLRPTDDGKNTYELIEPKDLTFKRFYDYSICHQSMFIKKDLFKKYGLYNEKLKIVSDWEFNVNAIVLNNCSLKYLDFPIVYYDMNGLSSKNQNLSLKEKEDCMKKLIPQRILTDYSNSSLNKDAEIVKLTNETQTLRNDLNTIQLSKFYKIWQNYNNFLQKIGIKK